MTTRRDFMHAIGVALAGAALPFPLRAEIRFGYASITWNGDDLRAIDEIAALGFPGVQLRSNILPQFGAQPSALRDLLRARGLTLVALSSGAVKIDGAPESDVIAEHVKNARFVRDVGGLYLQVTDERPRGRPIVPADQERLGRLLTEIGRRTADLGVPLGYHPHMGTLGERPEESERVLDAADAKFVKLELDVAHYQQGGGDPAQMIRRHGDRLLFLHIKDVERPARNSPNAAPSSYRFVELGRGAVDLRGVFAALGDVQFRGWAVIELDGVTDPARSARESAAISKAYVERELGLRVTR